MQMKFQHARLRRILVSAMLGAILPLAFLALRPEARSLCGTAACAADWDLLAFYIVQPALLFGMMAFSAWTVLRQSLRG